MKLPEFSVKKKVTASMMAMILVVLGAISFTRLGLDFFPDLEFPTVSVITTYSGASSEDIENVLTRPLEQVVSSVNRVKKVTSQTSEGVSVISVEFEWGTNLDFAAQDIRDQIGLYEQYLPEEAGEPLVMKFSFSSFPVIFYGITSDIPPMQLKTIIEDEVAPRLERIDGVASARVFSMDEREILVDVDRASLESRGLTLDQVRLALRRREPQPPGREPRRTPHGGPRPDHGRVQGPRRHPPDRRRHDARRANPSTSPTSPRSRTRSRTCAIRPASSARTASISSSASAPGANTQIASSAVKKEIAALAGTIPGNPVFHVAMDQGDMIEQVTSNTVTNAWQGGLLAILLIFLFLRNWRPTFVISLAIPLSIVTTFIALYAAGYTLNLLTLGGLALGVGMLVDNAIVVIENVYRHLEEGQGADQASIEGAGEVGMAITASTLTTIAVFFPMIFASGITGKMTQALGLSIAFSLLASLFVALTVVPLSTSLLFRSKKSLRAIAKAPEERQFAKAKACYRKWLDWALHHRRWVLGGALLALLVALAIVPFLGTEFMPAQDRDMIMLKVRMPVGTALEETDRVVGLVENIMAAMPEITMISAQVGSQVEQDAGDAASSFSNTGTHEGLLWVGLVKRGQRKESDKQILERIRSKLPKLRGVKFEAIDMSQMMLGGSAAPVEIKLFGKDLPALKSQADQIVQLISGIEGRPRRHPHPGLREARGPDPHRPGAGLPAGPVRLPGGQHRPDGHARQGGHALPRRQRRDRRPAPVQGADTATAWTRSAASRSGRPRARRSTSSRWPTSRPARGPSGSTARTRPAASRSRPISPTGTSAASSGRSRAGWPASKGPCRRVTSWNTAAPTRTCRTPFVILAGAFALAILLIYMIMASQFEHFAHPFIIMFTVPLGIIGVIFGLFVTGRTVSLAALVGVIMLAGIAVNNGIVMIDYINQLIKQGRRQARGHPPGRDDAPAGRPADRPDDHPGHPAHGLLPVVGLGVPGPDGRRHRFRPDRDDRADALRHPCHLQRHQ